MSAEGAARVVRVFVSSPNDVAPERGRVQAVAAKLNREYEKLVRFDTVLWEEHFYKADRSFQPQIDRIGQPDACDVLVSIFWTRVGTELPAEFARMPNGKPYPSGTAYELVTALEASKSNGIPDVYVFRKTADAALPTADAERRRQAQTQLDALEAFWSEWFKSEQGHFKAAFQTFPSTDEFERQIEELLRQWLHSHRLLGPRLQWPKEKGSPFPGLAAFEADQAAVFFGRDRAIDEARRRLVGASERGTPFLLIVGASGSGKSSLARAGLIPRVTTPGVVETVDLWRVALMKPGEGQDGPVSALAGALINALPELAHGDFPDQAALADNLRRGGAAAARPIAGALARIAEAERKERNADQPFRARLVLLIDQLEELFAQAINDNERAAFAQAVKELATTGEVWCVATLRADLYELLLKQPVLNALKDDGARVDLGPPGAAELAEIVRAPAAAAGLSFEGSPEKGPLDERLLADARSADSLPLLQFALHHLYQKRVEAAGETRLTQAAYDELGGLHGAVAAEAERAVANLSAEALDALPRLLRRLAEPAGDGKSFTLREAERGDVAKESGEAALVTALLGARILVAGTNAAGRPTLRLAHDAVLTAWPRAAEAAQASRDFYRVRAEVEDAERRWREHGQAKDRLIQSGVPLAEAERLATDFSDELPPDLVSYVKASHRQARLRQRLVAGAAVFFFALAVGATGAGVWAFREQRRAEATLAAAMQTANGLVFDLARRFQDKPGMPISLIKEILDRSAALQHQLTAQGNLTPELQRSEVAALNSLFDTLASIGDMAGARSAAQQSRSIMQSLLAADPNNRTLQLEMAHTYEVYGRATDGKEAAASFRAEISLLNKMIAASPHDSSLKDSLAYAYIKLGGASPAGDAVADYLKSLSILERIVASDPKNESADGWRYHLSEAYRELAEQRAQNGKNDEAAAAYRKALNILEPMYAGNKLNINGQFNLAECYRLLADLLAKMGNTDQASDYYRKAIAITEPLAKADPDNSATQYVLLRAYENFAAMYANLRHFSEALTLYRKCLPIIEHFARSDKYVGLGLNWKDQDGEIEEKIGTIEVQQGDLAGALKDYRQALAIRQELAKSEPTNADWQAALGKSYAYIGNVLEGKGDTAGARNAYHQAIEIVAKLNKADPRNTGWQHGLGQLYYDIADVQLAQGDRAGALKAFGQSVSFREKLAESAPSKTDWQSDLAQSYKALGDLQERQNDLSGALKSYRSALVVREKLARSEPANPGRQNDLANAYSDVADILDRQNDLAGAIESYRSSLAIEEKLAKTQPRDKDRQAALLSTYQAIGDVQVSQGDIPSALTSYQAALGIAAALSKSDPGKAQWQLDLARLDARIADANLKQKNAPTALAAYQAEAAILARLTTSNAANKDWQRELALSYESIGALQRATGNLADALASYRRSLNVVQNLATSDPANTLWQRALEILNREIAQVQMAQHDLPAALSSFRASAASAERLAEGNRGDTGLQHELAAAYDRIGDVELQQGDLLQALTAFRRSLAIRQSLVAGDPKNVDWRNDLQISIDNIGGLAYSLVLHHDFATALQAAEQAIALAPDQIWLYSNRAHALMFLGRADEARALYLKYRGEKNVLKDGTSWPAAVLADFAELRKVGLTNPLMDEIEKDFKAAG